MQARYYASASARRRSTAVIDLLRYDQHDEPPQSTVSEELCTASTWHSSLASQVTSQDWRGALDVAASPTATQLLVRIVSMLTKMIG